MKKTLLLFLLISSLFAISKPYSVTFKLDMTNYTGSFTTPEVNGTFNSWCGASCNPMSDPDGDGIWEATVMIPAGSHQYKFALDNWSFQENLTPGSACTQSTGSFTNRVINVTSNTVLPAVCWSSCVSCASGPTSKMVTFKVDMADYTGPAYTGVFLNGSFNGWCGVCNPMTLQGNNVWTLSIPLTADSIEYKFTLDGWNGQEALAAGTSCTKTLFGFTNRFAELLGDTVLNEVCWNQCTDCVGIPSTVNVTFKVNMNNYTGLYSTVNLNGNFNGWCGACAPMADPDGDGIYELTVNVPTSGIEFKYSVDGWTDQETLTPGSPCTITIGGFTNRFLMPTQNTILSPVCWASCSNCSTGGNYDLDFLVNMSAECAYDSVDVAIDQGGWMAHTMNPTGNGSFATKVSLPQGMVSYKFRRWIGGTVVWESISNRTTNLTANSVLPEVCFNSVSACDPIPLISSITKVGNPKTYKVNFTAPAGQLYALQLKGPSDVNWTTPKTWSSAATTNTNFQAKVFSGETNVRIGVRNNGIWTYSCEESFTSDCKPMSVAAIQLIAPFCEGDSAQLKVVANGGFKAKTYAWSNGKTTRYIYGQQGQTYTVVVTDQAGCQDSATVTVSTVNTTYTPKSFTLVKPNAVSFSGSWTAPTLASGVSIVGYRMAYRNAALGGTWTNTPLSSGTTATVNFTGSGRPSGNYEFTVFTRVNDNGTIYNTQYACPIRRFYNGSGAKWDGDSEAELASGIRIYPNPTQSLVQIQSKSGIQSIELCDLNGKRLMQKQSGGNLEDSFTLENFANGVYLVRVLTEDEVFTERINKQ